MRAGDTRKEGEALRSIIETCTAYLRELVPHKTGRVEGRGNRRVPRSGSTAGASWTVAARTSWMWELRLDARAFRQGD